MPIFQGFDHARFHWAEMAILPAVFHTETVNFNYTERCRDVHTGDTSPPDGVRQTFHGVKERLDGFVVQLRILHGNMHRGR